MKTLNSTPARPRRKRRRPNYPAVVGAGLIAAVAACGGSVEVPGGGPGPSDPPPTMDGDIAPVWAPCPTAIPTEGVACGVKPTDTCVYAGDYVCPSGEIVPLEEGYQCVSGAWQQSYHTDPECNEVPGGAAPYGWDCPADEPTAGTACDVDPYSYCIYSGQVTCPDGQLETIVTEYQCVDAEWELTWHTDPLCLPPDSGSG